MSYAYKQLGSWQDLEQYGIIALTGEACSLSMRLLCDLTADGVEVVTRFLGGNLTFQNGSNWNLKGVASVMLPTCIYPELGAFCLHFRDNYSMVVKMENDTVVGVDVVGMVAEIKTWEQYTSWQDAIKLLTGSEIRRYYSAFPGSIGGRNQHQMTGRIE